MYQSEMEISFFYSRNITDRQLDPEEVELAFLLQNSGPSDKDTHARLVKRYATDLYRWVGILLLYLGSRLPLPTEIVSVLNSIFSIAYKQPEKFHGQAKVSDWLFSLGYQEVIKYWRNIARKRNIPSLAQTSFYEAPTYVQKDPYWQSLDRLPEKYLIPLILRYCFELDIPAIAHILKISEKECHLRLVLAREQLCVTPVDAHMIEPIQAFLDGIMTDDQEELGILMQHLEGCDQCRSSMTRLSGLENLLIDKLRARWQFLEVSPDALAFLQSSITDEHKKSSLGWNLQLPVRQTVWIVSLVLTFIVLAVIFVRIAPQEKNNLKEVAASTVQETPDNNMPRIFNSPRFDQVIPVVPQYIEPSFSSDGNWAVFAALKSTSTQSGFMLPTIEIYNRESNTIEVIHESTSPMQSPWIWWDMAPSISGDGRWIVFVDSIGERSILGDPCKTDLGKSCLDIFIYDRVTGLTKRITRAVKGGAANGDSIAPTISENGKWLAYWSTADNLVERVDDTCEKGGIKVACLSIHLYDIEKQKTIRIPFHIKPDESVYGVDKISLSADGRYIGFTASSIEWTGKATGAIPSFTKGKVNSIAQTNQVDSISTSLHSVEAILYDQETGVYELQNQTPDGILGDGISSSPVISADGRFVAFISASTNLVDGDTNYRSDVFVRDRSTRKVELISVSSSGALGNGYSGLTTWNKGFFSLNISRDGRYVIFESTAKNLGQGQNSDCNYPDSRCNILYIRDLQNDRTEWIAANRFPNIPLFPQISSDGRWVTFMQLLDFCSSSQLTCSNVMQYDRQNGWMTNITKYGDDKVPLPWSYSGSISLTWQAWESMGVAFSPDSKLLALGSSDSKVRIWQSSSITDLNDVAEPITTLNTSENDPVTALAFSPGGDWLVGGTSRGLVYVWDRSDWQVLYILKDPRGQIKKLAFSQDGTRLVVRTINDLWLWKIVNGSLISMNNISYQLESYYRIDVAPNADLIAVARADGSITLQSLSNGIVIAILHDHGLNVGNVEFSDDGSMLAVQAQDGITNIWQIDTSDPANPAITMLDTIYSYRFAGDMVFSPQNKYLASTGFIGGLWRISDGKLFSFSPSIGNRAIYNLAFSPLGDKLVVVLEDQILLWDIPTTCYPRFFTHAMEDTYVGSRPKLKTSVSDIPLHFDVSSVVLLEPNNLDWTTKLIKFNPLIPAHLPENAAFESAYLTQEGSVWFRYKIVSRPGYESILYIYEMLNYKSPPPAMIVGGSAFIIQTSINTTSGQVDAEYVHGDWIETVSYTPPMGTSTLGEVHTVSQWQNTALSQRLRWQQNDIFIAMYYQVYQSYTTVISSSQQNNQLSHIIYVLDMEDLLQIAGTMREISSAN